MRRLLVGQQKQQIDVGIGRHLSAPIAADRDDRQLLARGRVGQRVDPLGDEVVEHPDQLIDQKALFPDRSRGIALSLEAAANLGPAVRQRGLQRRQQDAAVEPRRLGRGDRLRQFLSERPPVDDVALPLDIGHQPLRGAGRRRRK